MTFRIARAVAAVAALLVAGAAHAQSSIGDCEKIQAADAYNQCLAKFGPTSKVGGLEPERPGDIKANSEEAAAGATRGRSGIGRRGRHARGGGHRVHRGSSRKRLVISR